jgi:TatD DNase family protein
MLIDTHCHLGWDSFDADRDAVIERALAAGVERLLTVGTDLRAARKAVEIAQRHAPVYAAFAIHPHDTQAAAEADYAALAELARQPKVVAYGEIGLDFYRDYSPRDVQAAAFRRQIRLARELNLPIIIHDREAHDETLAILRAEGGPYRGVFHCFAGDEATAAQVVDLGFYLSFPGSITFNKEMPAHRVLRACPRDRLLIETDAPFIAPKPFRGKRNEPAHVRFTAERAAEVLGMPLDELARQTAANAYRLFRFEHFGQRPAIVYEYKRALYVNLTSRCSNRCSFCVKWPDFALGPHLLYLEPSEEPSPAEVIAALTPSPSSQEIVFCGMGEPTLRWDALLEIARALKAAGTPRVRLNTNGQGDLIVGRPIAPEMAGVIDAVSVSLNAPDAAAYQRLCNSQFGEAAFPAILAFVTQAKQFVPEVVATAVNLPGLDLAAARRLAEESLRVPFRVRG